MRKHLLCLKTNVEASQRKQKHQKTKKIKAERKKIEGSF